MARKSREDKLREQVETIADEATVLIDKLDRLRCPLCGQLTLEFGEPIPRSGVTVSCTGLATHTEDNHCPFEIVRTITSDRELPQAPQIPVEEK